ncbi:MAG TPA: MFS transporter [Thermoanaerobaculia bacterium]|nr:MFS transporter [Thermoanaerobaculia bacterium]
MTNSLFDQDEDASVQVGAPLGPVRRMFSALHYRDFRLLWTGAFVSTTGTWMQTVAQSWVVLSMTGSAFLLGFDAFLATLPMILFSLLGGVAADRVDRRKLLLLSQLLQLTFAFTMAGLIFSGRIEVWHIFVLSFLTGTAQSFGGPAFQSLMPTLVKRSDVPNAIAMNSIQFNLARVIGPVLAGGALAAFGAAACFGLNGLSFVAVIIVLFMIRSPFSPEKKESASVLADIREGLRFMRERRALMHLSLFAFISTFFGVPLVTLLPVVAKSVLEVGATGYSWILGAYGAGSVAGAFFVAAAGHSERKGRLAIAFQIVFAVCLFAFAFSRSLWLSMAIIFLAGASLICVIALVSSLVQLATIEAMRGRVMSIFLLAFRGGMPLGNLLSGFVAERTSVTVALATNAVCLAVAGCLFMLGRTDVKRL